MTTETQRGPYIDVRGTYPVYVHGPKAIELRFAPRNITVAEAELLINTPVIIKRQDEDIKRDEYKTHLMDSIKWWMSYRERNKALDPETHILDRVGTINGVIRSLKARLEAIEDKVEGLAKA